MNQNPDSPAKKNDWTWPECIIVLGVLSLLGAIIIDDVKQHTLASSSTVGSKLTGTTTEKAQQIGTEIAKKAKKVKIETVVFDRNGHKYAKRLRALADAARKEGLRF